MQIARVRNAVIVKLRSLMSSRIAKRMSWKSLDIDAHRLAPSRSHLMYFQFRIFPSLSHCTEVASRSSRVGTVFASVTHSTYSRFWLGLNPSYVASAFLFLFTAARK